MENYDELSDRIEQLEYSLERTNKQLLELTERHDALANVMLWLNS